MTQMIACSENMQRHVHSGAPGGHMQSCPFLRHEGCPGPKSRLVDNQPVPTLEEYVHPMNDHVTSNKNPWVSVDCSENTKALWTAGGSLT